VLALAAAYIAAGPAQVVIEARASQYSARGGLKGKLLILMQRPGRLRLEGLSPTDDMVSVLATDGERFTSFQRGAARCWVGRACPANVGRFVAIPIEPDELVGTLLGRPPLLPHQRATMKWDGAVGAYRVDLVGDASDLGMAHGRTQRLWVAHGDGRILRATLLEGQDTKVDVVYSDWRRLGERLLPGRLDITLARERTDLRLEYRDVEAGVELPAEVFVFTCPAGAALEELPCLAP